MCLGHCLVLHDRYSHEGLTQAAIDSHLLGLRACDSLIRSYRFVEIEIWLHNANGPAMNQTRLIAIEYIIVYMYSPSAINFRLSRLHILRTEMPESPPRISYYIAGAGTIDVFEIAHTIIKVTRESPSQIPPSTGDAAIRPHVVVVFRRELIREIQYVELMSFSTSIQQQIARNKSTIMANHALLTNLLNSTCIGFVSMAITTASIEAVEQKLCNTKTRASDDLRSPGKPKKKPQ
nr:hypothetical protein CFP56_75984 [Quercus suber]